MNKFALVSMGLVGGFAVAMVALPEAKGANDASAYGQLDLFSAHVYSGKVCISASPQET